MVGQAVSGALIVAGVLFFFALLRAAATRPAKRDKQTGELVLQCSEVLVWTMGLIAIGGPLSMGLLSLVFPFKYPNQVWVPVGIGAFFLLLGGMMSLWAARRRTRVGDRGLTSEYVFAGPRLLDWQDVTKVSFASGQEFWAHGPRHKAMLHVWFRGVREAVPLLDEYLPEAVRQKYGGTLNQFAIHVGA